MKKRIKLSESDLEDLLLHDLHKETIKNASL